MAYLEPPTDLDLEIEPIYNTLADIFDGMRPADWGRAPVIRIGEREPISGRVRHAVYARERYRCLWCCTDRHPLQLDHIVPWSAGGSDHSSNLRALCATCNENRSNFVTGFDRPMPPCAFACVRCAGGNRVRTVYGYCVRCGGFAQTLPIWTL